MWLFLAVLLAVSQAPPPVPGKAADSPTGTSPSADTQTKADETKPAQSQLPVNPVPAKSDEKPANTRASDDVAKTVRISELPPLPLTRDWVDHLTWVSTLLLVIAGFRAIYVARQTLKVIKRQALSMRRQTTIMRNSVAAAKEAAEAAKASADALIQSERAWIMADLSEPVVPRATWIGPDTPLEPPRPPYWSNVEHHGTDLHICIRNEGKTPAWITGSLIRFELTTELPQEPDFIERETDMVERVPYPLAVGEKHEEDVTLKCVRKEVDPNSSIYVYGFVRYRDAFGEGRETRFGYTLVVDLVQSIWCWERMKNPNHNKHT